MHFNNNSIPSQLLCPPYFSGPLTFSSTTLYSPTGNTLSQVDLKSNSIELLPFQMQHFITLVRISPDGSLLVAVDNQGNSIVYNVAGAFVVGQFNFGDAINTIQFSEDGKLIAVGIDNGFKVYECPSHYRTFQPFLLLKQYKTRHSSALTSLVFTPDSRFIFTASSDHQLIMSNLFPLPQFTAVTFDVHRYQVIGVYCLDSMEYVYSVDRGGNVMVWQWVEDQGQGYSKLVDKRKRIRQNKKGGQKQQQPKKQEDNQEQELQQPQPQDNIHLSQFQKKVQSGRFILSKKQILSHSSSSAQFISHIHYTKSISFLLTATTTNHFSIHKMTPTDLTMIHTFSLGSYAISSLTVDTTCSWIALGVEEAGQLIVWEWRSGSYILNMRGTAWEATCAADGGKWTAVGTEDGRIKLWDRNGFSVITFQKHTAAVTCVKFSSGNHNTLGSTLFSCSKDGAAYAYDCIKHISFRAFTPPISCQLTSLALDQPGELVYISSFTPYSIFCFSIQTGLLLQEFNGHQGPISCISVSGDQLISGSWDRNVRIWEIYSKKSNVESREVGSQVTAIAVGTGINANTSTNSSTMAVATRKGQIYVWDNEGKLIGIIDSGLQGGRNYFSKMSAQNDKSSKFIKTLMFSPCGKYLYGGGKSKYLHIYSISQRSLIVRIPLTKNKDLPGVVDFLNSKFIVNGVSTYGLDEEQEEKKKKELRLPGVKKMDVGDIKKGLEVEVREIVSRGNKEIVIVTSFGVIVLGDNSFSRKVFNPVELRPDITPSLLPNLIANGQFSSAVVVVLKLNLPIRLLLPKLPINHLNTILSQLPTDTLNLLIVKLAELQPLTYREMCWVESALKKGGKAVESLRVGVQGMQQQVRLMERIRGVMQIASQSMAIEYA